MGRARRPLRRPAASLRPKALRAFRCAPDKYEKTDKPVKQKKQEQAPEETVLTAEKMSYLLGTHVSLTEQDHQAVKKTQEVTNHNQFKQKAKIVLPPPAIRSVLVLFIVTHMCAHSSFKFGLIVALLIAQRMFKPLIIARHIALMLIMFSAFSVIKTGPDSPGYNACVLLRSRQRDYSSPLHPSGGYTAHHAAPAARPASTEHCTNIPLILRLCSPPGDRESSGK